MGQFLWLGDKRNSRTGRVGKALQPDQRIKQSSMVPSMLARRQPRPRLDDVGDCLPGKMVTLGQTACPGPSRLSSLPISNPPHIYTQLPLEVWGDKTVSIKKIPNWHSLQVTWSVCFLTGKGWNHFQLTENYKTSFSCTWVSSAAAMKGAADCYG